MASIIVAMVTEPVDEFVLSFLNLDVQGSLLKDVVSKGSSPLKVVQTRLTETLFGDVPDLILRHFGSTAAMKQVHFRSIRSMVLQLSGELYLRLDVYFDRFPFKLLRLVCSGFNPEEQSASRPEHVAPKLQKCVQIELVPYCGFRASPSAGSMGICSGIYLGFDCATLGNCLQCSGFC